MDVTLLVVGGKTNTSEVKLSLPTVIGRGPDCKLKLSQPLVSRRHCELYESQGRLLVRDLGSMNGTYVGSERVEEAELPHEGLLTIGAVTFRALYQAPGPVDSANATHHDFDSETKSDVLTGQSVEIADPMDPLEIDAFEDIRGTANDLTQPAPPPFETKQPNKDLDSTVLPPSVDEHSEGVVRHD